MVHSKGAYLDHRAFEGELNREWGFTRGKDEQNFYRDMKRRINTLTYSCSLILTSLMPPLNPCLTGIGPWRDIFLPMPPI